MPPNYTLKMVNFMLYVFYHNLKNKGKKQSKRWAQKQAAPEPRGGPQFSQRRGQEAGPAGLAGMENTGLVPRKGTLSDKG